MWDEAESKLGGSVSVLVNNAGVNQFVGWNKCIDIMVTGTGLGTTLAMQKMGKSNV
jgi:NAD(P)-dependent dehydrogenase (short-subunit alcohol dehydrogenase family)